MLNNIVTLNAARFSLVLMHHVFLKCCDKRVFSVFFHTANE